MDTELLKSFVEQTKWKKELEENLKIVKAKLASIEPVLMDNFVEDGLTSAKIDGLNVYIHKQIWAKYDDKEKAIAVLKTTGYNEYVSETFNTQSVSSLLRELDAEGKNPDDIFAGVITKNEVFSLRTRKA